MISVYDIETFKQVFTCTFKDIKTLKLASFVVSPWQNDFIAFVEFFLQHEGLIGYNNVDFDYRVVHPFISEPDKYKDLTGKELVKLIYKRSQQVIDENFKEERAKPLVPQRDLFRIWHFNNKARMVSLKYLQINMVWKNVQESPFKHDDKLEETDVPVVLEYNINDVESTFEFYNRSKDKIRLRKTLGDKYGANMGNYSDNKIGETIFLKELSRKLNRSEKSLASCRTPRANIPIRDCLVSDIKFETKEFKGVLEHYSKMVVTNTRKASGSDVSVVLDNTRYDFGLGGLHALRAPGLYRNLYSADVSSYYPNLAISYNIYPHHLGSGFCDVYKKIYEDRKKYPKKSDENIAYKATLVCVFGQSNAPWSIFYDPMYTMKITINGQLLLAMLCERIVLSGAGHIIMANTDGIEVDVKNESLFKNICEQWQRTCALQLEYTQYKLIAIRDVNAYCAVTTEGIIKNKGDFETEKDIWKDQSMKIVPIAVNDYFARNISVEQTINNCKDIKLFLMGKRAKTGNLEYRQAKSDELMKQSLPKNVRYFVSRSGGSIVKVTKATDKQNKKNKDISPYQTLTFDTEIREKIDKKRITDIHSGYRMTLFNKWIDKPFEQYDVEKQFYIREANKLINSVIRNQMSNMISYEPLTDDKIMWFGKYEDQPLGKIPNWYLEWMLQIRRLRPDLEDYIKKRLNK